MTPFLRFRLWLRHGPAVERALIGVVGALVVAAPLWVLLASDGGDSAIDIATADSAAPRSSDEPPGQAMGERPATGNNTEQDRPGLPSSQLASDRPGAAATELPGTSPNTDRCAGLRATDQGVSATEILVAVPFVNLAGEIGNESVGIRGNLAQVAQAAAAGINRQGGVACRQLRVKTYSVNPLDQTEQRARCLEIVRDKPFAVIDFAGYNDPANRRCLVDAEIPYQGYNILNEDEIAAGRPFLYSFLASGDRALRNWVFEAAAHGLFDRGKGFRKLGLLVDECNPRAVEELSRNLERVGVPRQDTAMFILRGCASINSPSELAQAVAQHRNNVTHVFLGVNSANGQNYVRQADAVRWKPVYSTSDFTSASNPVQAPRWPDGFDGAVVITSRRGGERNSGIVHPETATCNEWMSRGGAGASESEEDENPLAMCDMFRLFAAGADAVGPQLVRASLLDGLEAAGRFEGAATTGGLYNPQKPFAGDFVRAIQWHLDCKCFKVIDRDLKPGH